MNILTLNFSPKGEKSISYQYYLYAKQFIQTSHSIEELMIGKEFQRFCTQESFRNEVLEKLSRCDTMYIISPVYAYMLPAEIHDFFTTYSAEKYVKGKAVFGILSSAKVHDDLALSDFYQLFSLQKPVHAISLDMELKEEPDLKKKLQLFVEFNAFLQNTTAETQSNPSISIITDNDDVAPLIGAITDQISNTITAFDLREQKICNCRGDLACMLGECIFKNDDFVRIFNTLRSSDIVIFGLNGTSLSGHMRTFFSRALSVGQHHESLPKKQFIFINFEGSPLLTEWIKTYSDMQSSHLAGILTSESGSDEIRTTVMKAIKGSELNYIPPQTYRRKGAFSIFHEVTLQSGYALPKDVPYFLAAGKVSLKLIVFRIINVFIMIPVVKHFITKQIADILIAKHKKVLNNSH